LIADVPWGRITLHEMIVPPLTVGASRFACVDGVVHPLMLRFDPGNGVRRLCTWAAPDAEATVSVTNSLLELLFVRTTVARFEPLACNVPCVGAAVMTIGPVVWAL
jgi:hypothetical protein